MSLEDIYEWMINGGGDIFSYEFKGLIKCGGFSQVWKVARDGKIYALKAP